MSNDLPDRETVARKKLFASSEQEDFLDSIAEPSDAPGEQKGAIDWLGTADSDGDPSVYRKLQSRQREIHESKDRATIQTRRRWKLRMIAVVVGAVLGAIIDISIFGDTESGCVERIAGAILGAAFMGGMAYASSLRMHHFALVVGGAKQFPSSKASSGEAQRQDPVVTALRNAWVVVLVLCTFIATGHVRATIHAYVVVLACETVVSLPFWWLPCSQSPQDRRSVQ